MRQMSAQVACIHGNGAQRGHTSGDIDKGYSKVWVFNFNLIFPSTNGGKQQENTDLEEV